MELNDLSLEAQAELVKEAAAIGNQSGHRCLLALVRRCEGDAMQWALRIAHYDHEVTDYWDAKEKEFNVDHIYRLPDEELKKGEKILGDKLRKIWNDAQNERAERGMQWNKIYLAIKLICFLDYGFLQEKK